jgi:hypothetical protein
MLTGIIGKKVGMTQLFQQDGTVTAAIITGEPGGFYVSGEHAYAEPGEYSMTVTITKTIPGGDDEQYVVFPTAYIHVPPGVSEFAVNDGHEQRSMVNLITLTFDREVDIWEGGFTLVRRGDDLLCGIGHIIRRDDRQARVLEDLLPELLVRALHAHDERHRELHLARGGDHAGGDGVALHDAAEDVH